MTTEHQTEKGNVKKLVALFSSAHTVQYNSGNTDAESKVLHGHVRRMADDIEMKSSQTSIEVGDGVKMPGAQISIEVGDGFKMPGSQTSIEVGDGVKMPGSQTSIEVGDGVKMPGAQISREVGDGFKMPGSQMQDKDPNIKTDNSSNTDSSEVNKSQKSELETPDKTNYGLEQQTKKTSSINSNLSNDVEKNLYTKSQDGIYNNLQKTINPTVDPEVLKIFSSLTFGIACGAVVVVAAPTAPIWVPALAMTAGTLATYAIITETEKSSRVQTTRQPSL